MVVVGVFPKEANLSALEPFFSNTSGMTQGHFMPGAYYQIVRHDIRRERDSSLSTLPC